MVKGVSLREVERSLSFIFEAAAVLIVYVSSLTIEGFLFTLVFVLFLGFLGIRYAYMHTYAKFGLLSLHVSRDVRGHDS
jgi:hypothetical protein